jgi:hypothetical protein
MRGTIVNPRQMVKLFVPTGRFGVEVMADAKGNEFCAERSAEVRAAAPIPPS